MGISLAKVEIVALFLETLLYGIFLTLFIVMVVVLAQRTESGAVQRRILVPVGAFMLANATAHIIISFVRAVQGFVIEFNEFEGGATGYYENISNPLHVGKSTLYVIQTLIGDAVLIWRFFVVYGSKMRLLIPMLVVWVATAAVGFTVIWALSQAGHGRSIFATASAFITSFCTVTMTNCVICTAAITWKIYATGREVQKSRARSVWPIVLVIAESGALYTAGVMGLLISYESGSNGQYCAIDAITPLVGITFCLIVLQIRYHLDSPLPTFQTSALRSKDRGFSSARTLSQRTRWVPPQNSDFQMEVRITHETESYEEDMLQGNVGARKR